MTPRDVITYGGADAGYGPRDVVLATDYDKLFMKYVRKNHDISLATKLLERIRVDIGWHPTGSPCQCPGCKIYREVDAFLKSRAYKE